MLKVTQSLRRVLFITVVVILVSTCGSNISQEKSNPNDVSSSPECRIVEHDAGETQICNQPQKVAAISAYTLDIMLSLGAQPTGYAEHWARTFPRFDNPSQQIPYLGSRITTQPVNLGIRGSPSLEALTALKPDLILTEYQDNYELLSRIAPTVYVDYNKGGWQRDIHTIAKALYRETQVQQVLANHEQQLSATQTKLTSLLATHSRMLPINVMNWNAVRLAYKNNPQTLLNTLGFQLVRPENMEAGTRKTISIEALSQLEADIVIASRYRFDSESVWNNNSYDVPLGKFEQEWNQIPLLKNWQPNQEGCVYFVDGLLWGGTIRGPIADEIVMQQLPELLLPPCQNSKSEN